MSFFTTPDFWDCECEKEYVHTKKESECYRCGAVQEEQPDSRVFEISRETLAPESIKLMRKNAKRMVDTAEPEQILDFCYPRLVEDAEFHK